MTADLVASRPQDLRHVCKIVADDPNVDNVLVVVSAVVGATARALARSVVEVAAECPGRISVAYLASHDRTLDVRQIFAAGGVPVFSSINSAVSVLGRLARRRSGGTTKDATTNGRTDTDTKDLTTKDISTKGDPTKDVAAMTEARGAAFLRAAGISIPLGELATNRAQAAEIASRLGDGLVLKLQSPQIVHKTELGLVVVGVGADAVAQLFDELMTTARAAMPHADIDGVLIQQRAATGVELLVDVQIQDNGYPPLLTVGLGGTAVELYADVTTSLLPITHEGALRMLQRLQGYPLLDGFRGAAPLDVDAAARSIVATAELAAMLGDQLVEFEINPLIVHARGTGATAVDFVAYFEAPGELDGAA